MENNKKILETWNESIKDFERLDLAKAKELYKKYLSEENKDTKEKIRETIITGLFYTVYDELIKINADGIIAPTYDMDDVINGTVEYLIRSVDSGKLLGLKRLSTMYSDKEYLRSLKEDLIGNTVPPLEISSKRKIENEFNKIIFKIREKLDKDELPSYHSLANEIEEKCDIEPIDLEVQEDALHRFLTKSAELIGERNIKLTDLYKMRYFLANGVLNNLLAEQEEKKTEEDKVADTDIENLVIYRALPTIAKRIAGEENLKLYSKVYVFNQAPSSYMIKQEAEERNKTEAKVRYRLNNIRYALYRNNQMCDYEGFNKTKEKYYEDHI